MPAKRVADDARKEADRAAPSSPSSSCSDASDLSDLQDLQNPSDRRLSSSSSSSSSSSPSPSSPLGPATQHTAPRQRTPRNGRSIAARLEVIVGELRDAGWTFRRFLQIWVGLTRRTKNIQLSHNRLRSARQRRSQLFKSMMDDRMRTATTSGVGLLNAEIVEKELDALTGHQPFGKFDNVTALADMDFAAACTAIERYAPTWYALMKHLCRNRRCKRNSYPKAGGDTQLRRIFIITSIVCHERGVQTSNFMQRAFGCYAIANGVPRRVLQVLQGFGICDSYQTINAFMKENAQTAKVQASASSS